MHPNLLSVARGYLGTPFHHQGRVKGVGVDCAGFLVCIAKDLGYPVEDLGVYDHDPDPVVLRKYLEKQLVIEFMTNRTIGNIVLMDLGNSRWGHHLGLLTDIGIIHALASARKVVETTLDQQLDRSIVGVYSWPN